LTQRPQLPREIRQVRPDSPQPVRQNLSRPLHRGSSRLLPPDLSRLLPRAPPRPERLRPEEGFVAQREIAPAK